MTELPSTWIDVAIGEIAEVISGGTPKANDTENFTAPGDGISWLTPADLSGYKAKEIAHGARDLTVLGYQSCSAKLMPKGSLLFSSRAPIGYVAIAANEISTNQGFKSFVFTDEIDPNYAFYYLKSIRQLADSLGTGTTFKELSGAAAKTLPFRLAPTTEQTRIAAKLDELLTQVDALKARIDGIPALLKRFRQSVLSAAVSGRLTEEWREQKDFCNAPVLNSKAKSLGIDELASAEELLGEPLPCFWSKYALDQLVDAERGIPYGIVQTGSAVENGIPTVRCGDVKKLYIDTSNLKPVSSEIERDYKRTRLKGGEVLLAIRGSVGNAGVTPKALHGCNISREVAMIPTLPSVLPFYLACLLQSPFGQRLLVGKVRGVAQKGINLADVRRLPVALPPYEEQTEIVRRVEQLFAFADQLEARVKASQARIDRLTQSILAKAFRGELVPQDPNDEPASVLLERIKAQRAAAPKAKRGRGAAKLS